ncbi:MAG: ZIP family metal transporter [Ruminococcaceae bacterium]|nr:ZIP family metal transporter [Oscillospiraceae bacterium]
MIFLVIAGILIPFAGTALGAAAVFLMKKDVGQGVQKLLSGFAAGVMVAASIWSLLLPALERAAPPAWLSPSVGFVLGIGFLMLSEAGIVGLQKRGKKQTQSPSKNAMLILAVTLHNIPEGLAVGVAYAGAFEERTQRALAAAFLLALGIAVQNIPEGAIISMPLRGEGKSRWYSFACGSLSGAVEPVAAALTFWMTAAVSRALPLLLAFAAGAMFYVCVDELIPEAKSKGKINMGVVGFGVGFLLMMILDVALG